MKILCAFTIGGMPLKISVQGETHSYFAAMYR